MAARRLPVLLLGAAFLAGACTYTYDGEPDSVIGISPTPDGLGLPHDSSHAVTFPPPPELGRSFFRMANAPHKVKRTGTPASDRVSRIRDDLAGLHGSFGKENTDLAHLRSQARFNLESDDFSSALRRYRPPTKARTNKRRGPVAPDTIAMILGGLEKVDIDLGQMRQIRKRIAADAARSTHLLEKARATFGLAGANAKDHRQLETLEADINRLIVQIDQLLTELSDDIHRLTDYVAENHEILGKHGDTAGPPHTASGATPAPESPATDRTESSKESSTSSPAESPAESPASFPALATSPALPDASAPRHPLVVIRFDRLSVDYREALTSTVKRVLESRPDARFDLLAVSTPGGEISQSAAVNATMARRNAQAVLRSLVDMGLQPGRVMLTAQTAEGGDNELRLYLR